MNSIKTIKSFHLKNPPIIFAFIQVRFSPILAMNGLIPDIQNRIRKLGFSNYNERNIEESSFTFNGEIKHTKKIQWEFIDSEFKTSIILDTDFVAIQTTFYDKNCTLLEQLHGVIDIIKSIASPARVTRVGTRYIDLIIPKNEGKISEYINKGVFGNCEPLVGEMIQGKYESLMKIDEQSVVAIRGVFSRPNFVLPQDLLPLAIKPNRDLNVKSQFYRFDFDHIRNLNEEFDPEKIKNKCADLHKLLLEAFANCVTEEALEEWGVEYEK